MGGYETLGFLGILRESMKFISKNGRLIATITSITILLNSLLFFTKSLSTKPSISDLVTQETLLNLSNPNASNFTDSFKKITNDVQIIIGFELLYLLPSIAISLFSMVTMILASMVAYNDKNMSFQDFFSRIPKLFLRTLVTSFYVKVFETGYIGLFLALLFSLSILSMDHLLILKPIATTVSFFAFIFRMYLVVVWDIALLISVIEKSCYGLEAFGKAARLVKGKRRHGAGLHFLYMIVAEIISMSFKGNPNRKQVSTQIICAIFALVFGGMVKMVYFMSYTVLYFQYKKTHGEEIESQGSFEYSEVPSVEVVPSEGKFNCV